MDQVEQVDQGGVPALDELDVQLAHEPAQGDPEVIPHHDDGLDAIAVALPQRAGQLRVAIAPTGVQPLLELIEDDEDLLVGSQALALPERDEGSVKSRSPESPGRVSSRC